MVWFAEWTAHLKNVSALDAEGGLELAIDDQDVLLEAVGRRLAERDGPVVPRHWYGGRQRCAACAAHHYGCTGHDLRKCKGGAPRCCDLKLLINIKCMTAAHSNRHCVPGFQAAPLVSREHRICEFAILRLARACILTGRLCFLQHIPSIHWRGQLGYARECHRGRQPGSRRCIRPCLGTHDGCSCCTASAAHHIKSLRLYINT